MQKAPELMEVYLIGQESSDQPIIIVTEDCFYDYGIEPTRVNEYLPPQFVEGKRYRRSADTVAQKCYEWTYLYTKEYVCLSNIPILHNCLQTMEVCYFQKYFLCFLAPRNVMCL